MKSFPFALFRVKFPPASNRYFSLTEKEKNDRLVSVITWSGYSTCPGSSVFFCLIWLSDSHLKPWARILSIEKDCDCGKFHVFHPVSAGEFFPFLFGLFTILLTSNGVNFSHHIVNGLASTRNIDRLAKRFLPTSCPSNRVVFPKNKPVGYHVFRYCCSFFLSMDLSEWKLVTDWSQYRDDCGSHRSSIRVLFLLAIYTAGN